MNKMLSICDKFIDAIIFLYLMEWARNQKLQNGFKWIFDHRFSHVMQAFYKISFTLEEQNLFLRL